MWKSSNSWLCYLCVESYICEFCVCVCLLSLCGKTVTPSFFLSKILWCDLSDTPFALRVNVNRVVCFWLVQDLSLGANRGQPFSHHVLLMRLCCWPNLTFSQLIWEICDNVIIIRFLYASQIESLMIFCICDLRLSFLLPPFNLFVSRWTSFVKFLYLNICMESMGMSFHSLCKYDLP